MIFLSEAGLCSWPSGCICCPDTGHLARMSVNALQIARFSPILKVPQMYECICTKGFLSGKISSDEKVPPGNSISKSACGKGRFF